MGAAEVGGLGEERNEEISEEMDRKASIDAEQCIMLMERT